MSAKHPFLMKGFHPKILFYTIVRLVFFVFINDYTDLGQAIKSKRSYIVPNPGCAVLHLWLAQKLVLIGAILCDNTRRSKMPKPQGLF